MSDLSSPSSLAAGIDEDAPICPICGYDLRGAVSERCSECGQVIDWQALKSSGFPWARRRQIGRLIAYIQTVWLVTIDSRRIRYEASRAQDLKDASRFRWVTAGILAAIFLVPFVIAVISRNGLSFLAVSAQAFMWYSSSPAAWLADLLAPWSAGATIVGVAPAMLILLALHLTSAQRQLFRVRGVSPARQQRLTAISLYASAPLAWLVPAAACFAIMAMAQESRSKELLDYKDLVAPMLILALFLVGGVLVGLSWARLRIQNKQRRLRLLIVAFGALILCIAFGWSVSVVSMVPYGGGSIVIALAGALLLILTFLAFVVRTVQWSIRVRHAGLERSLIALPHLLGLWLFGLFVLLVFIPWCIGFIWIVIDSFL